MPERRRGSTDSLDQIIKILSDTVESEGPKQRVRKGWKRKCIFSTSLSIIFVCGMTLALGLVIKHFRDKERDQKEEIYELERIEEVQEVELTGLREDKYENLKTILDLEKGEGEYISDITSPGDPDGDKEFNRSEHRGFG